MSCICTKKPWWVSRMSILHESSRLLGKSLPHSACHTRFAIFKAVSSAAERLAMFFRRPVHSTHLLKGQPKKASARQRIFRQVGRQFAASAIALTAFASAAIAAPPVDAPSATQAKQSQSGRALTFDQLMSIGYRASKQGDFNTALINFRRALAIRPGQPYAAAAADNMVYYIQYERMSERRRAISQLEARLAKAQAQKDWVCAATTIDQLTTYTQPDSLNRERLIGQRGEVSGLLDARIDSDRWSTVCAAQNPIY